jgi:hypothetical protein
LALLDQKELAEVVASFDDCLVWQENTTEEIADENALEFGTSVEFASLVVQVKQMAKVD